MAINSAVAKVVMPYKKKVGKVCTRGKWVIGLVLIPVSVA